MNSGLHRLAVIAAIISFFVIVLGAYVRLSHAGLGCPDWPGCYGQLTWPDAPHEMLDANLVFPERPVEIDKAWKEMVHRYLAGSLVLLVLSINFVAWKTAGRQAGHRTQAGALLAVILFQAALGMWTVTLKLWPIVVMGHLLGGLLTFGLLLWLAFRSKSAGRISPSLALRRMRPMIMAGLVVVSIQVALGGWTSANYSALACPDFPTCQGQWWPQTNFADAFALSRHVGVDYEGGILDLASRVSIQITHRVGALFTLIVLGLLAFRLTRHGVTQRSGILLAFLLATQVTLGILNVLLYLPLANAVAHTAVGALLVATMIWLLHLSSARSA